MIWRLRFPFARCPTPPHGRFFALASSTQYTTATRLKKLGLSDSLGAIFRGIAGVAIVLAEAIGQDLDSFATPSTAALIRRHAGAGLVL